MIKLMTTKAGRKIRKYSFMYAIIKLIVKILGTTTMNIDGKTRVVFS